MFVKKSNKLINTMLEMANKKRMRFSILVTSILYLLLLLFLIIYSLISGFKDKPIGASIVYVNLNSGRQKSEVENESEEPKQDVSKEEKQVEKKSSPKKKSSSKNEKKAAPKSQSNKNETVEEQPIVTAKRVVRKAKTSSSNTNQNYTEESEASSGKQNYRETNTNETETDWNKVDSALSGSKVVKKDVNGSSPQSGGNKVSTSIMDLDSLNTSRRLLKKVDPNLDNVDAANRKKFSFVISFDVLPSGAVASAFVIESSGSTLADQAMERAIRQWQFEAVGGSKVVNVRLRYYVVVN